MALTANQDWLYKQMSGRNVDLGSEEQFAQAMQDENNRQWVYDQAGKMGIDLGTPEQFASAMLPTDAVQTGVSGGSLLSEQEELARQNAIQGVTDDPYRPHVEQKQPNAFQTFYKGLGAGVINTANGLLGFLNRANSGRLAYDPVTLQQMAKQGKSPEEIEQAAQATRERLDNAETERYNAWKAKADQLATEAKPDGGEKSFTDYLNPQSDDFDLGKALQLGLGTAAESLPYTLSALNPVATASMIMSMSEQNYRQSLIDNPDMSDGQRLASAAGNAAIEMAVEHIGNPFKVFKAGKLTAPNATKWIKQVVKESKDNIYKGILRVLGFGAKEAGKEGLEEVITTAGQDLYNTLLDWKDTNGLGLQSQWERMKEQNPDITPEEFAMYKAEGLTNDFIGGALSGMMMSGPSTGVGVARAAKYYSKNGGSKESRAQAQQQLAVLQQLATEFDVTEEEVAQAIVDYQAEKQLTPKQQALINRGEEIITNLQNAQSATQATELQEPVQETTPLSPTAAEYARVVNEVTQSVRERTHGNGYIYLVAMQGKEGLLGNIVGEVVPVIDESNPEQLRIENDDVVTVKWSDGTVTQERARDLDLIGDPLQANEVIDADVENQMYAYTQQRIQNGEQPVLMRNGEGILEGFFPTEGGLLEDQNGVQYTPEQLAEQGWQETKPVLFVNDQQQIAALDNGDGTYTQVDALGNPIAEPMSAEVFSEQGFAMVPLEKEQPKSQAPVEAPIVQQAPVEQTPEVQQPEVKEPAAPVVPNIETMSAEELGGSAVEYMGDRASAMAYLEAERDRADAEVQRTSKLKVTRFNGPEDFKRQNDQIQAAKRAAIDRYNKLQNAITAANAYKTLAEQKEEAERKAREAAMREQRRQLAAARGAQPESAVPGGTANEGEVRPTQREQLTEYLNGIADEEHPFELFDDASTEELLRSIGASEESIERVKIAVANGAHVNGIKYKGRIYLNVDECNTPELARTNYVHERQHLLTTKADLDRVFNAVSYQELNEIVDALAKHSGFYLGRDFNELADEFISFGMEAAYQAENDAELEAALRQVGANDKLVNIIKSINNEQRANENLSKGRRNAVLNDRSASSSPESGRDQTSEPAGVGEQGTGIDQRSLRRTEGGGSDISESGAEQVTETPAEDNAHLSDNESAFVAPQMPIDTQTNAQKQSKTPAEEPLNPNKPLNSLAEVKKFMDSIGYEGTLSKVLTDDAGKKFVKFQANGAVTPNIYLGETTPRDIFEQFYLYDNVMEVDIPADIQTELEQQAASAKEVRDELWADDREQVKQILSEEGIPFVDVIDSELGSRIIFTDRKNENGNYIDYMDVSDADQAREDIAFIRTKAESYKPASTENLTPLEAAQKRKAAREAAKAAEQAAQPQGESEMLTRLRELQEGEDQQAPQDYLHSLTDEQLDVLEDEVNELWNKARTENNLRDLNDQQIREQYPEAWKTLLMRNRVSAENSRRYDMQLTEESIANRKAHTESEELRRYYEYEFAYMRASASKGDVLKAVHDAEEYLAGLSYEELAKIYNEIVRLQSEHDVPWILRNAYRARSANMENEGVFDYGLNHQGEIPEGKANKPKINANDWTANDELRPVMNGVYHDPTGVGVVTNAHILMATPSLYDPAQEGKIVKKDGSVVDGKFPNWQGVVDQARRINKKEATVDWDAIRNFIAGVKAKMKAEGTPLKKDSLANIIIRMPDGQVIIFRLNSFIPFADAAAAVGANTLHYSPINGQTLAEVGDSHLVIMPVDPESFKKAMDWGDVDNFYYDLQPKQDEPVSAETPKTESKPERKPKPTRKKAAPAEQTQTPVETDAEVIETQKPKNTDKIEDVGEKIGGARKDIVQETVDRINVNGDTFAKIFPKFDYHKLIANGLEPRLAAGLKYVCEHAKKSYKIRKKRFGENNALDATRFMANYAKGYLLGDTSLDFTSEGWVFTAYGKRRYEFGIKLWESLREAMGDTMFDVDLSGYDCDVIQSEEERKAEAEEKGRTYRPSSSIYYRRNADGESVEFTPRYAINTPKGDKLFTAEEYDQAVQYFQDQVTSAINYQAANPFELAIYRKRGSDDCCVHAKIGGKWVELTPWGKEYGLKYRDEHRAELQAMAQRKAEELKEQRKNTRPEAKVELRLTRREDGTYGNQFQVKLGKEYVPIKDDIMPITDSYNYLREHRDELAAKAQELLNAYLDEQEANRGWKPQLNIGGLRNRVGTDWRNGADVTAERFRTEFGFRGVEFGNYVTQKERQRLLNECFDALHDMAEILGVSPRALSLNGQLGFAIGARGGAGAKAHYEPGKNVINLTKKNGWGALAHEWWHAMDYYFGKREKERPATSGIFRDDVRKQMQDAFAAVMKAINGSEYLKRSQNLDAKTNKRYYAEDTELGARAFEDYIAKQLIERGQVNDFLSHHTSEEDWNGDISNYPYPIEKDGTALADAFQSFFDTVEEQEDESTGNSVLFSVTDKKYAQFALTHANNPMLDDVHTGIRSVEDIHTLEETLNDDKLLVTEPDWEEEDIRRAIEDNQVTIYSSKPIQDGTFVTPSRMVAEDYAGGEIVYEKTVSPDKVAWIASDEGQYADVDHYDGILFSYTPASDKTITPSVREEMESIKNEAVNNGTFMQAPNGKPTNLTERQWLQVRLRSFKRWFGDWENDPEDSSKVLDVNGEPMVAKHGTPFTFTTFDKSKQQQHDAGWLGRGFYFFTKNDDYAAGYAQGGRVLNTFLNIREPYFATNEDMERLSELEDREESARFTQQLIDDGYDGVYYDGDLNGEYVAFEPNQIKSATDNDGSFSEENDNILFSISNARNDIFYSNAERAVEGIKQDKATPEQWRAMIEKAGGLKAGEDKWIGLSDWLAQQRPTIESHPDETPLQFAQRAQAERKKFTISKQEILHYIRANKIQIEETEYGETTPENNPTFRAFQDEVTEMWENVNRMQNGRFNEANQNIIRFEDDMQAKYGDDWRDLMDDSERNVANYLQERRDEINMEVFLPEEVVMEEMCNRHGDDFQLAFSIDDDGSLSIANEDAAGYYLDVNPINDTRLQYTTEGLTNKHEIAMTVPTIEAWNESDEIHFGDAGEGKVIAWARFGDAKTISKPEELAQAEQEYKEFSRKMIGQYGLTYTERVMSDSERQQESDLIAKLNQARKNHPQVEGKVLVIDEIQSKRHQEGREHGYIEKSADKAMTDYTNMLYRKYGVQFNVKMSDEERMEYRRLQREREFERQDNLSRPTPAPFEKNWHELAMKRILRFAAENGYDKVAWTTGEQQAARYNIGNHVDGIDANPFRAGVTPDIDYDGTQILIYTDGATLEMDVDKDGNVVKGYESASMEYEGKNISDIVGKEIARKLLTGEEVKLRGEDFRIGGEGMRGFYDDILPRFMQKYGKKWGVQVGEVTMPQLEDGYQTMHAIDITDAMRESVLEGQPMFSISGRGVNGTMKPQEGETRSQYIARVAETVKNMTPRNTTIDDAIRFSITVNHNSPYLLKRADGSFVDPETGERLGFDHRFMGQGEGGQSHGWGTYLSVNDLRKYADQPLMNGGLSQYFDVDKIDAIDTKGRGRAVDAIQYYLYSGKPIEEYLKEHLDSVRKAVEEHRANGREEVADEVAKYISEYEAALAGYKGGAERHHYSVEIPDNDGTNYLEEDQPLSKEQIERIRTANDELAKEDISEHNYIRKYQRTYPFSDVKNFLLFAEKQPEQYPFRKFYGDLESFMGANMHPEYITKLLQRAGFVGIHYDGRRDGECYVIFNPDDAVITDHIRFSVTGAQNEDDQIRFSVVTSRKKIAELEAGEKIKVYRAAQVIDGKLYPPMAAKQQGQLVKPIELGRWEQAEEHPELAKDGKFKLDKANGSSVVPAAYNPYFHTSRSPLNDQFSSAYDRPNLVTLEVEVPTSELTSGYKAEGAKDAVGETNWHSGAVSGKLAKVGEPRKVILSRWDKPLRIVPDAEVAEKIAGMLAGKDIAIPYNVVTPSLRAELKKQGVTISDTPSGTVKKPKDEIRFSVTNNDLDKYKQVATDAWNKYQYGGELESIRDVAEYIEDNMPKDKATAALFDAIDKWRAEEAEDRMLYGERGDLEPFEDAILNEIELLMKPDDQIRFSVNNPSTLSRSETVTKALVQQANNNYNIMQSALKKVTADLKGIRAAMRMQSDYDRKVVDALLNLYNTLLQENGVWAQYMPDTTRRIATQIVHAIGKRNITEEVNTIMDHMVHAQAKAAQRQWDKLRQTPIDKINISGVVMQGKVALEGQHALKAMNDALQANMTIEQIEEQINQLMDMEDNATDESLKTQYKGQWIGLTIAAQHLERLQHLQEERQQLDLELQSARSNKALKPAARQQLVDNIKQAMRDNYIEQAEAYTRSTQDLSEYVNTQEGRAKDFIRRQDANRDKIRSYAQRDLEGLATNPNRNRTRGNVARSIWDAFASPIRDLQSLLRLTGLHAPDGEGYLYNHFMRNWMDGADMERTGIVAASKTLDEKIAELTHGKYKTWEEAARKINDASHNMFGITMLNGVDGKDMPVTEEIPLNAGNALYIYAVNKMNDGRMKLNGMNITEEDVQALADKVREQFGQEILDVVDWVQSEFFSQLRNRYNPTHEALFGAPMDAIENYFPLRINANARQQNEDLSEPDTDAARLLAGTSTGAIKRRTRNSLPLDVRNADFFQEVIRHISQMERWNAFAQWNRDANILFSDINFRNRIKGMKGTIYGEGDKLYNYMKDAFRVAIGTYKPNADGFSKEILNAAKGVTSAKINFRIFTALKQIASFPAFFTYMQDGVFVGSYLRNWLKPHETMKWAKENLPNFEKRVSKRDMGDMRLMQRSTDWQWNKRILEWSSKYGMFFNVFFDTLTCATGARAVYDSHLADYLKKGYSEEDARNRARQDAEQAFNTSQQSSEGAFMAPIQMDRNAVTAALTVFRTSPMQYTRNFFFHVRGLLRKIGDGKREEQIAFRMGQYKNDGLNDEQARKAAEKDYNKSIRADVTGVVVYGALLGILWRLVGSFPYLFFGDDDDKKKQIVMDAVTGGAFVQPITGLIGGSYIESALDGNGLISSMFAPELPFTQDAKRAEQYLQNNKYAEFASQALSVLMQSGTGFDPLTASDMVSRIVTTLDSEEELDAATQALRVSQAILSIPQSQYEQMLIDKVVSGKTDEDAALEDYIRYQKIHTAPLTWWLRGEESDEKAEENAEKRFNKLLTERDKIKNPEDYEE